MPHRPWSQLARGWLRWRRNWRTPVYGASSGARYAAEGPKRLNKRRGWPIGCSRQMPAGVDVAVPGRRCTSPSWRPRRSACGAPRRGAGGLLSSHQRCRTLMTVAMVDLSRLARQPSMTTKRHLLTPRRQWPPRAFGTRRPVGRFGTARGSRRTLGACPALS